MGEQLFEIFLGVVDEPIICPSFHIATARSGNSDGPREILAEIGDQKID
jgi:hypothetical protein